MGFGSQLTFFVVLDYRKSWLVQTALYFILNDSKKVMIDQMTAKYLHLEAYAVDETTTSSDTP